MIEEIVSWLLQRSDLKQAAAALELSNLIFVCYFAAYLFNRKAVYITVFFIAEVIAYSDLLDELSNWLFYFVFAALYSTLYHFLYIIKSKLNTVLACGIIIVFNILAAADAYFYPETYTLFYKNYESLTLAVHFYFIFTLINWKILRRAVGASIDYIANIMGVDYSLSHFWYTIFNHN